MCHVVCVHYYVGTPRLFLVRLNRVIATPSYPIWVVESTIPTPTTVHGCRTLAGRWDAGALLYWTRIQTENSLTLATLITALSKSPDRSTSRRQSINFREAFV